VLPSAHRLRRPDQFRTVLRGRRDAARLPSGRAGGDLLVLHLVNHAESDASDASAPDAPRVGFVVSKAVGNAVARNRTRRRLRHLMAARLADLPAGTDVVVRAQPRAALADSAALGAELDRLLATALRRARPARVGS
jgi:ribonuclease P protein component